MKLLKSKNPTRRHWIAAAAITLTACGGGVGELLLAAIVTPLGGLWVNSATNEGLQITAPGREVQLFSSTYAVEGTLINPVNFCDVADDGSGQLALAGSYDNGKLVLHAKGSPTQAKCIEVEVTSLIRMQAPQTGARPARSYVNSRVDVQLDLGLWVSANSTTQLKFSPFASIDNGPQASPLQACDVSPGTALVLLDGQLDGYIVASDTPPSIPALQAASAPAPRFTELRYTAGDTITLRNAGGQVVTLTRRQEATPTVCPRV